MNFMACPHLCVTLCFNCPNIPFLLSQFALLNAALYTQHYYLSLSQEQSHTPAALLSPSVVRSIVSHLVSPLHRPLLFSHSSPGRHFDSCKTCFQPWPSLSHSPRCVSGKRLSLHSLTMSFASVPRGVCLPAPVAVGSGVFLPQRFCVSLPVSSPVGFTM